MSGLHNETWQINLRNCCKPLNLGKELGFEDTPGFQGLRDLSSEEEATLCQVNQDVPYNLTQVHATAHLLISKSEKTNI